MRYKEYLAQLDNLEKRLGILGEQHIYTPEESSFAHNIVPNFDTVAVETEGDLKSYMVWISLLHIPKIYAFMKATNRSFDNDTSANIAKMYGKRIVRLEEDIDQLFPLKQKIMFAVSGGITIPISPIIYGYYKYFGDPTVVGTRSYEKRISARKDKKSLFSRFYDYGLNFNLDERNKLMADKSIDCFRKYPGSLLIVPGENHLDGLIENLYERLKMEEIRSLP